MSERPEVDLTEDTPTNVRYKGRPDAIREIEENMLAWERLTRMSFSPSPYAEGSNAEWVDPMQLKNLR